MWILFLSVRGISISILRVSAIPFIIIIVIVSAVAVSAISQLCFGADLRVCFWAAGLR